MKCSMILKLMLVTVVCVGNISALTPGQYAKKGGSQVAPAVNAFIAKNSPATFKNFNELRKKNLELLDIIKSLPVTQRNAAEARRNRWHEEAYDVIGNLSAITVDDKTTYDGYMEAYANLKVSVEAQYKKSLGNRGFGTLVQKLNKIDEEMQKSNDEGVKKERDNKSSELMIQRNMAAGHLAYHYFKTVQDVLGALNNNNVLMAGILRDNRTMKNRTGEIKGWINKLDSVTTAEELDEMVEEQLGDKKDEGVRKKLSDELEDYNKLLAEICDVGGHIANNIDQLVTMNDLRNESVRFFSFDFKFYVANELKKPMQEFFGTTVRSYMEAWQKYGNELSTVKSRDSIKGVKCTDAAVAVNAIASSLDSSVYKIVDSKECKAIAKAITGGEYEAISDASALGTAVIDLGKNT